VAAVIVLFVFVQLGFYAMIQATSPYDPIWFHPDERAPGDLKLWASLGIGGGLSFLIIGITAAGMFGHGPGLPGLLFFVDDVRLPCTSRYRSRRSLSPGSSFGERNGRSRPATASSPRSCARSAPPRARSSRRRPTR